jgi:hypothetical protein
MKVNFFKHYFLVKFNNIPIRQREVLEYTVGKHKEFDIVSRNPDLLLMLRKVEIE